MHPGSFHRQWRVPVKLPLVKLAGAGTLVALGLLSRHDLDADPAEVATLLAPFLDAHRPGPAGTGGQP
ncbi:hypothetical protein [Micromonospora inyonensis]|uniref:Uncharacterized protein n=1 Tax=Micromonospora inyonensis TaxID=47866 RepID=A0A1C6RE81_9ACTN|nr:hypothetical protein [Micromonospora inyonensis]SCL15477.1 hypothetical protein GA0074694_1234 [Micromonospora inyonensis]